MEKVRLDKNGRLTIPAEYRERPGLSEEVALILEEDHLVICRIGTVDEIRVASRRLAEEITDSVISIYSFDVETECGFCSSPISP